MREIKTRWSFSLKSLQIWTISFHLMFSIPIQLQLPCGLLLSFFLLSRSPMQLFQRYFQWFSISYTNLLPGFILQLQPISKASKPCLSRSSFINFIFTLPLCLSEEAVKRKMHLTVICYRDRTCPLYDDSPGTPGPSSA